MKGARALNAVVDQFEDFDIGRVRTDNASDIAPPAPFERRSYALMRASLNVFVQQKFADDLNAVAFDRGRLGAQVRRFLPEVWPHYLDEAQQSLPTARLTQVQELGFADWRPGGRNLVGAWHRLTFQDFHVDVLIQLANPGSRLGAFRGLCFLGSDRNHEFAPLGGGHSGASPEPEHQWKIAEECLSALGITAEATIAAIAAFP